MEKESGSPEKKSSFWYTFESGEREIVLKEMSDILSSGLDEIWLQLTDSLKRPQLEMCSKKKNEENFNV